MFNLLELLILTSDLKEVKEQDKPDHLIKNFKMHVL